MCKQNLVSVDSIRTDSPKILFLLTLASAVSFVLFMFIGINELDVKIASFSTIGIMVLLVIVQALFHEAIHGFMYKHYGANNVTYKFHGVGFSASCNDLFTRKKFVIIGIAPVITIGILLTLALIVTHTMHLESIYSALYFNQVLNIIGSVGDFYIIFKIYAIPQNDLLFKDLGLTVDVYKHVGN